MTDSPRRQSLQSVTSVTASTNADLWFDRFYDIDPRKAEGENKRELINRVATLGVPEAYTRFFTLWTQSLPAESTRAIAKVQSRMVIGTGDKGVAEAGITLHHTYGVPFIPGSALKGLASSYAATRLEGFEATSVRAAEDEHGRVMLDALSAYHTLFGAENSAGYVTFFDALYVPGTGFNCTAQRDTPLQPDVITSHHSAYYVGDTPKPPADWDSPIPVPFLTATGEYLIVVGGAEQWTTLAIQIIGMALRDSGIGAKTAAGYGRMALLTTDREAIALPVASSQTTTESAQKPATPPALIIPALFVAMVKASKMGDLGNKIAHWQALSPEVQPLAAQLILDHAAYLGMRKVEERGWYALLRASIDGAKG